MHGTCSKARHLAQDRLPFLILGEAGVGKTTFAMAIHQAEPGSGRPFETLDCAVLTPEKLRAELERDGLVARLAPRGGTLCLDQPDLASHEVQVLLPALLEQLELTCDARHITLSSESLYDAVIAGSFRNDLYFRLAGARPVIPPLRERRDEIMPSLGQIERKEFPEKRRLDFTAAAEERRTAYHWSGNLREMENLIRMLQSMIEQPIAWKFSDAVVMYPGIAI